MKSDLQTIAPKRGCLATALAHCDETDAILAALARSEQRLATLEEGRRDGA